MTEAKALKLRLEEAEAIIENGDQMPLDLMLAIMRNRAESRDVRFAAAKAAAPYCHPQLQQSMRPNQD
jgi:hypothetical protein